MHGLYTERRTLHAKSISRDIATHIYARQLYGTIVVVGESPSILASSVSKQWRSVTLRVQRERSSTLNPSRIRELNRQLAHIQHVQMRAKKPVESLDDNVFFINVEQALALSPICHTMYVTCRADETEMAVMTRNMEIGSLLVLY